MSQLRLEPMLLLLLALAASSAEVLAQDPPPPQPKFETGAEVVLVDVSVVSGNGEPVTGLASGDFKLTVNGQPRTVHTVQFISTRGMRAAPAVPRLTHVTSNEGDTSGRLLLFVVDENHLRLGGARGLLTTANRVMSGLAEGDAVGVARLPTGRGGVEFTTNRERIRRALSSVMGAQPMRNTDGVRLSEAHAFDTGDTGTWEQVVQRECGATSTSSIVGGLAGGEACQDQLQATARNVIADASQRARVSIVALEQLATRLALLKTPVSVVLISEGLYLGRDRNDLSTLARLAAEARVTFYVVQPDESWSDLDRPSAAGFVNEAVLGEGLEQIASLTRGAFFKVAGGDGAFDRISRELSGYYLLSFEPTAQDRTAKERRIRVEVSRRGVTVKARSTYAMADRGTARDVTALPPEEHVKSLLASPLPSPGLPMRVATYSVTSEEPNRVRVVLAAEMGAPATNAVEWPVGVMVFNSADRVFVDTTRYMTLEPVTASTASPRLLTMTMVLEPGEYTLRLAAVDHEGNAGSVHHTIDARLHRLSGDAVRSSDLIISGDLFDGRVPRPVPTGVLHAELLYSILELAGEPGRIGKARVSLEIGDTESSPALLRVEAQPLPVTGGYRSFAAVLKMSVLPPGEYVVRAIVRVPGTKDAVVSRPFRLEAVAASSAPAAAPNAARSVDEPPAPLPASRIDAPVTPFSVDEVLAPGVVRPFLERLGRDHPLADANRGIMEKAVDAGVAAIPTDITSTTDLVAVSFLRGLAFLHRRQYSPAATAFQTVLQEASDFLGAAFYLGAVHAAMGRDNDAIGAWQLATIGDGSEAVYPHLVDALLRIGDTQGALDMIAEAPEAWPSDQARLKRMATAHAMQGRFDEALTLVGELLERGGSDPDVLFVAVQVLYRQHTAAPLAPDARARFDEYSKRYLDAKGPWSALVETWRRFVMRR